MVFSLRSIEVISSLALSFIASISTSYLKGKDDFLGRCVLFPKVRLKGIEAPEPKLLWHKVKRGDQDGGEILAECELFLVRNFMLASNWFLVCLFSFSEIMPKRTFK